MNRVVALGIVGWIAFAALGGCQGADPFDRAADGTGGGGGKIVSGNGGRIVTGNGGSGLGGRASGGTGAGGSSSMGGRGAGGSSMGGRGAGGVGTGGSNAGGSNMGGRGMGGTGAGGRAVDAGANCVSAIVAAGYAAGSAPPCSACMDQNHTSFEMNCKNMLDCMATSATQPCTGGCELECFNHASGSGPLQMCIDALLTAGGCQ